jgi:hypothetical protein
MSKGYQSRVIPKDRTDYEILLAIWEASARILPDEFRGDHWKALDEIRDILQKAQFQKQPPKPLEEVDT